MNISTKFLKVFSILLVLVLLFQPLQVRANSGAWSSTGDLLLARYSFRATNLPNGQVLATGGFAPGSYASESEVYDPASETWTRTNQPMSNGRAEHTATLLADGTVLVAGGYAGSILNSAEIYNPSTRTFISKSYMSIGRTRHTATLLTNGKVLITGGWAGVVYRSTELYNPLGKTWTYAGNMAMERSDHISILLKNGKVLVAGGQSSTGVPQATAELYDPSAGPTGTWSPTKPMNYPRALAGAVRLNDGKVLVIGGWTIRGGGQTNTAELYDPDEETWTLIPPMSNARTFPVGQEPILLPDGSVIVAGGDVAGTSELYLPDGTWTSPIYMVWTRNGAATALLPNGKVLVAGGHEAASPDLKLVSTQIFEPKFDPPSPSLGFQFPFTDQRISSNNKYYNFGYIFTDTSAGPCHPHLATDYIKYIDDPILPGKLIGDTNAPVYAVADGEVVKVGHQYPGYGDYVVVKHILSDDKPIYSLYAHLDPGSVEVESGIIFRGDKIADQGASGGKWPVHLHFELRYTLPPEDNCQPTNYVDPEDFIVKHWWGDHPSLEERAQMLTLSIGEELAAYQSSATINQGQSSPIYHVLITELHNFISFVLDFPGSSLKLRIFRPDGSAYGEYLINDPPHLIIIPNPELGEWGYSVEGVDVPYSDYPYVVNVGKRDKPFVDTSEFISPPLADAGGPYFGSEGESILIDASGSSDPGNDIISYDWDLDNDGTFETPGQNVTFSAIDLDGPDSRVITLQVTDSGGLSATDQAVVNILNVSPIASFVNDTGNVDEGGTATLAFKNPTDPGSKDSTAGFLYSFDCNSDGIFEISDTTQSTYVCSYIDNSIFTAHGRIKDKDTGYSDYTASVTVTNIPPMVEEITAPLEPVQVNGIINPSARFVDPGVLDTHTAFWDWGDGNTSAGSVSEMNGSGSAGGSHSYSTPGVYTLGLTITDKDSGVGWSTYQYLVVYDPNGGFVTGGGWIISPEGAYTVDPTLTGRANFGFVAKYQKGANIPIGNTEFQFKVADLNFNSDVYEWLVVSGARAKFKGEGSINGEGNYKFMLTAIDGQIVGGGGSDIFRIKIWWEESDGTVHIVYDNQLGLPDDGNPTSVIQGGSIVVHKIASFHNE